MIVPISSSGSRTNFRPSRTKHSIPSRSSFHSSTNCSWHIKATVIIQSITKPTTCTSTIYIYLNTSWQPVQQHYEGLTLVCNENTTVSMTVRARDRRYERKGRVEKLYYAAVRVLYTCNKTNFGSVKSGECLKKSKKKCIQMK